MSIDEFPHSEASSGTDHLSYTEAVLRLPTERRALNERREKPETERGGLTYTFQWETSVQKATNVPLVKRACFLLLSLQLNKRDDKRSPEMCFSTCGIAVYICWLRSLNCAEDWDRLHKKKEEGKKKTAYKSCRWWTTRWSHRDSPSRPPRLTWASQERLKCPWRVTRRWMRPLSEPWWVDELRCSGLLSYESGPPLWCYWGKEHWVY